MHPDSAPPSRPATGTASDRPRPEPRWLAARERVLTRLEARGRYPTWVLLAALAGMFATTFPITILTVSLGSIAAEFSTSETTIAWVISAPMLLSAVVLPLLGKLGDLRGHRLVFLLGFAGATVVAALTAIAWSPLSLIGLRTLAAVLGGATQPTSMALIFSVYEPERRVRAMGWWSMTGAAAPALGLIAGGPLVDFFGWRFVFVLQAILSAFALLLAAVVLRETPRQRVRFDLAGGGALALGVGGLMLVLGQIRSLGARSPLVLFAALVALAGLGAFIAIERRTPAPLLPLGFFARRNFSAPIIVNALMAGAYMGAFVIAPFALIKLFGFSISLTAGVMLLRTLSLTFSSPAGGVLGFRIGERGAAVVGSFVLTLALALMACSVSLQSLALLAAALVLQGLGHGLGLPSLSSAISNSVPESELGIASAANRLTSQAGAAFGITLLTAVYGGEGEPRAMAMAFGAAAVLAGLAFLAALCMGRRSG